MKKELDKKLRNFGIPPVVIRRLYKKKLFSWVEASFYITTKMRFYKTPAEQMDDHSITTDYHELLTRRFYIYGLLTEVDVKLLGYDYKRFAQLKRVFEIGLKKQMYDFIDDMFPEIDLDKYKRIRLSLLRSAKKKYEKCRTECL